MKKASIKRWYAANNLNELGLVAANIHKETMRNVSKSKALDMCIHGWKVKAALNENVVSRFSCLTCPLCWKYITDIMSGYDGDNCKGCPIADYSGSTDCKNTPYVIPQKSDDRKAELEFLKKVCRSLK